MVDPKPATEEPSGWPSRPGGSIGWVEITVIGVISAYTPLQIYAVNLVGVVHPERLFLLAAVTWIVGMAMLIVCRAAGLSRRPALFLTSAALICVLRGWTLTDRLGVVAGWLAFGAIVGALGLILRRLDSPGLVNVAIAAIVVFFVSGLSIDLIRSVSSLGPDVSRPGEAVAFSATETPDILLVVLDGHAGTVSAPLDFGIDQGAFRRELEARGFQTPTVSFSSYPTTTASVPSLVDMSYPIQEGPGITLSTVARMRQVTGGDNALFRSLKSNGYQITMIEAGWSGSKCGKEVDVCVVSPLLDDAMYLALQPSMFATQLNASFGSSFTLGAQRTMDWLVENVDSLAANGRPDLVFAHVMAPHQPFFLDADCDVRYAPERLNFSASEEQLGTAQPYLEQARCVDDFVIDLSDKVSADSVLVFAGDHGTDSHHQLRLPPDEWSSVDIRERFNPFVAVRAGDCDIGDDLVIPNLMRRVLACFSSEPIPQLDPRVYLYTPISLQGESTPVIKLPDDTFELLGPS
jgi:hypothetical protein